MSTDTTANESEKFRKRHHGFSNTKFEHYFRDALHVAACGAAGVFSRQGLYLLVEWFSSGTSIFPAILANITGSALMGALIMSKGHVVRHTAPAIYLAATTGYCGCVTTFSSWSSAVGTYLVYGDIFSAGLLIWRGMVEPIAAFAFGQHVFQGLYSLGHGSGAADKSTELRDVQSPLKSGSDHGVEIRGKADKIYDVMYENPDRSTTAEQTVLVSQQQGEREQVKETDDVRKSNPEVIGHRESMVERIMDFLVSVLSLDEYIDEARDNEGKDSATPGPINKQRMHNSVLLVIVALIMLAYYAALITAVIIDPSTHRLQFWWWPGLFAPFGAVTRWMIGLRLNNRYSWPAGTFVCNILASALSAVLSGVVDSEVLKPPGVNPIHGILLGFNGGLSTVSSFVAELYSLPRLGCSYWYGMSTVITAIILVVLGYGPWRWSGKIA
eukprot:Selendium_serpulae@DN4460_c0_g1_i2.p1